MVATNPTNLDDEKSRLEDELDIRQRQMAFCITRIGIVKKRLREIMEAEGETGDNS